MPVGHRRRRPNQGSIHSLHEQHGDPKRTPHGDKDTRSSVTIRPE